MSGKKFALLTDVMHEKSAIKIIRPPLVTLGGFFLRRLALLARDDFSCHTSMLDLVIFLLDPTFYSNCSHSRPPGHTTTPYERNHICLYHQQDLPRREKSLVFTPSAAGT